MTGKSAITYALSSPRSTSLSACFAVSLSRGPSTFEMFVAVAPTTKAIALLSRSSTRSTVGSAQIAADAASASVSVGPLRRHSPLDAAGVAAQHYGRHRGLAPGDDLAEADNEVLSCGLRAVERLIGRAKQLARARAVIGVRRDPGAQPQREPGIGESLVELPAKTSDLRHALRRRPRRAARTTNSSPPRRAAEPPRDSAARNTRPDLAEQGVAELMAGAVVDVLEVVAVEHDEAQRSPLLLRVRELALEPILEAPAVEQTGQSVRMGAQTLSVERERGIERGRRVGSEQRGHLGLIPIEGRRRTGSHRRGARCRSPFARSGIRIDRANPRLIELGDDRAHPRREARRRPTDRRDRGARAAAASEIGSGPPGALHSPIPRAAGHRRVRGAGSTRSGAPDRACALQPARWQRAHGVRSCRRRGARATRDRRCGSCASPRQGR